MGGMQLERIFEIGYLVRTMQIGPGMIQQVQAQVRFQKSARLFETSTIVYIGGAIESVQILNL